MIQFIKNEYKIWRFAFRKLRAKREFRWQRSNWQILSRNADDYRSMMKLAFHNHLDVQVLHNGHIAIELLLKAAISKSHRKHPMGHEIATLMEVPVAGQAIHDALVVGSQVYFSFSALYTAWSMQYRYTNHSISRAEALNYLNAFEDAIIWTKNTYCL